MSYALPGLPFAGIGRRIPDLGHDVARVPPLVDARLVEDTVVGHHTHLGYGPIWLGSGALLASAGMNGSPANLVVLADLQEDIAATMQSADTRVRVMGAHGTGRSSGKPQTRAPKIMTPCDMEDA